MGSSFCKAALLSMLLAGCTGATTKYTSGRKIATVPELLEIVSGDSQTNYVNADLPLPLVVRALDTDGLPVQDVSITFFSATSTLNPLIATTDSNGLASTQWTMGSVPGAMVATVAATAPAASITFSATAVPIGISPAASTLVSAQSQVINDGVATTIIKAKLIDYMGVPLAGKTVALTSSRGATDTITALSAISSATGEATFEVKSSTLGDGIFTAAVAADSITVTQTVTVSFVAVMANIAQSTLSASPLTVTADGVSTTTVTLTIKDAGGTAIAGYDVSSFTVASSGTANTLPASFSGLTNGSGQATVVMSSTKAEAKTIALTKLGWTGLSTVVTFVADVPSATTSTLAAAPLIVTANGTSTTTITLTLKDVNNNLVSNYLLPDTTYTLASTGTGNTLSAAFFSGTSNASGELTLTMASTKAEAKTIAMTKVGWTALSASVTFVADAPSGATSTLTTSAATAPSDGVTTATLTLTLKDANNNPVAAFDSANVTLAASGGGTYTLVALSGLTNAAGQVTTTIKSSTNQANSIGISAATPTGLTAVVPVTVTFGQLQISIADSSAYKGNTMSFVVTQNFASAAATTFNYATSNGTATSGTHYTLTTSTGTIAAGLTSTSVTVPTLAMDGTDYLVGKTFTTTVSGANNSATVATATATGTINDATLIFDFTTGTLPADLTYSGTLGAGYYNSSGVYSVTPDAVTPRYDYDPLTLESLGMLIEPKTVNFIVASELFSNGWWTKTGGGVTMNTAATTTPAGDTSADLFIEDNSTGDHSVTSGSMPGFAVKFVSTFSVYVKPAVTNPKNFVVLEMANGSDILRAGFNVSTGAVIGVTNSGTATGAAGATQVIGNGWYRIYLTGTVTPGAVGTETLTTAVHLSPNGSTISYAGDNVSGVYLWGAQMEEYSAPSSYLVSNTGTAATRLVESLSLSTSNAGGAWFGNSNTVIASYSIPNGRFAGGTLSATNSYAQFPYIWRMSSADITSSQNVLTMGVSSKTNFHTYKSDNSSSTNPSLTNGSFRYNSIYQVAATVDIPGNSVAILKNGGTATSASGATTATGSPFTLFDLTGSTYTVNPSFAVLPRHYHRLTFRPFVLSVAGSQLMTSQFSEAAANAAQSTTTTSAATVTADGTSTATIIVTLKNAAGNPVQGKTVTLAQTSGTGAIISVANGTSSKNGKVGFMVKSSTIGTAVFTATDTTDSVTVTQTVSVNFN